MRIIAGTAKGHPLKAPKGLATRPTTDRIREALFNILTNIIEEAEVLDLFAGTGALGIEALSRGAESATFVEYSLSALKCIKQNLATTKLTEQAKVVFGDAFEFLKSCQNRYDIIFIDPPYQKDLGKLALKILAEKIILTPDGVIIVETAKRENLPESLGDLRCFRQTRYGDTLLWFYHIAIGKEE